MALIKRDFKNISPFFSRVDDLSKHLKIILDGDSEAVFGVEIQRYRGETDILLVTPPYIRFSDKSFIPRLVDVEDDLILYEGYLEKPFFMPIYERLDGNLIQELSNFKDPFSMQWLFRKRSDDWREEAIEMYKSYVLGNDYPATGKVARYIQDKIIYFISNLGSLDVMKEMDDHVIQKINSIGYQFQLRVALLGENTSQTSQELVRALSLYDGYNSIKLIRTARKQALKAFREGILTYGSRYQILTANEITSLLGGKVAHYATTQNNTRTEVSEIIQLLPEYRRQEVQIDKGIVTRIAGAIKTVGLINTARVYNTSVTAGIRLTIVQMNIPEGKTLTQIKSKQEDIQAELGVSSLAIEQGEQAGTIKFSIPNENPAIISLRELISTEEFKEYSKKKPLTFVVGVDEINNPIYLSLAELVHLLVAGTTGSGKSVFINSLIVSLIATHNPDELRMFLIDPKQVELQQYNGFPHVEEVITDMDLAETALEYLVKEMDRRYTLFKENRTKNIALFNKQSPDDKIPYIVCVVDEYADLRATNPEVEEHITRLGQKARAAGIHLVIATQRPSKDIISGRITANIQNTISFQLPSGTDYRTVFGKTIPYHLLGKGDGVMRIAGYHKEFQRFQSSIISPDETLEDEVYENLKNYYSMYKKEPIFTHNLPKEPPLIQKSEDFLNKPEENGDVIKIKQIIAITGETAVRKLREELKISYKKANELVNQLIEEGWLAYKDEENKNKGLKIVAPKEELEKYRN